MIGLSAADEIAVERFLARDLAFDAIPELLRRGAEAGCRRSRSRAPDLGAILETDAAVRVSLGAVAAR